MPKLDVEHNWDIKAVRESPLADDLRHKIDTRTKPLGALGVLEEIAYRIGLIQNTLTPKIENPAALVFAADHGIADAGVSAYPKEVTLQMVLNFLAGGAAINVFAKQNGLQLNIIDAGVDYDFGDMAGLINCKIAKGTKNILQEPAMSPTECQRALQCGTELADAEYMNGCNTIIFGEMGIGNTSAASMIMSRILNIPVAECSGRGTGVDDAALARKTNILEQALAKYPEVDTPFDVLRHFGGFEIAMCVGSALRAAERGMVIVVDGFIITSAILVAAQINPNIKDYLLFAHLSDEQAHGRMIAALGGKPILNLNMRLGEGTGAAVCLPIIRSAVAFLNQMASFEAASVSDKGSR